MWTLVRGDWDITLCTSDLFVRAIRDTNKEGKTFVVDVNKGL